MIMSISMPPSCMNCKLLLQPHTSIRSSNNENTEQLLRLSGCYLTRKAEKEVEQNWTGNESVYVLKRCACFLQQQRQAEKLQSNPNSFVENTSRSELREACEANEDGNAG